MSDRWGEPITGKKTVKKGETLTEISKILDLPVDSLVAFNNLSNPNDIKVGQELLYRKEPGFWDNTFRWAFESSNETRDSREINNQITKNVLNFNNPKEDPEYLKIKKTIFKHKDIKNFANIMSRVYSKVLKDLGLPTHNIPNLIRQDALESSYGTSTRGNGYNLGGVKVFNNKNKLGTLYKDGFYYRNFNDLEDYAKYKVMLLENDYGGIISAPSSEFIDRLHGKNPGKKNYSARKDHYVKSFNDMITLNSYLKSGGKINKSEKGIKLEIPEIKVDPSIFTSWNAIKLPEIKIKNEEDGSGLSDYLLKDFNSFFYTSPVKTKSKEEENNVNDEGEIDKVKNNPLEQQFTSKNKVGNSNTYYYNNKEKWILDLTEAYKKAGITNPEALKYLLAQDALESGWGKSAQGNYNFGNLTTGSSWKGDYVQGRDKDANGNPISQKFRSYNSMDEYALDKVNFLTRLYDFNQNDNFQTFVSKLTGNNKGKRRYAEARNYGESLTKVFQSLINKHQEGGVLLSNPETSEMLTYIKDGKIITVPNPGAGFVSGTDPVGQVVVEGAILNKPLGWALGKAVNWAKNLLKNRTGNFTSSASNEITNNAEKIIKKEDLPSYAKPNWQGDALELTKDRLRKGGFDRLNQRSKIKSAESRGSLDKRENYNDFSEENKKFLLEAKPKKGKASDFNKDPKSVGVSSQRKKYYTESFTDAPFQYLNPRASNHMAAHEYSHLTYQPNWLNKPEGIDINLLGSARHYLGIPRTGGLAEQTARGTQLKNYFGLKEGEEITPEMWEYAKQNYVKDMGFDNNMIQWMESVVDVPKYLKWLNKEAPAITGVIGGGIYANSKKENK